MPIYDYRCGNCTHEMERIARVHEDVTCVKCGALMARLVSMPNAPRMGHIRPALKGGGMDRFTADVLGLHPKDLPDALKTDYKE